MKPALILGLALLPSLVQAQSATITSPVTINKIIVDEIKMPVRNPDDGVIKLLLQTNGGITKRILRIPVSSTELVSFWQAVNTSRQDETGGILRKMSFRMLGWLSDNNKLVDDDGTPIVVTLVP